jgi:predicted DNA-binding helix-hairpin-helix protein
MFTEAILKEMIGQREGEYVPLTEIVGEETLAYVARMSKQVPESSPDVIESIVEISSRVFLKFQTPDSNESSEDVPRFDPENFNEELESRIQEIRKILNHGAVEKSGEEFPVLIDMFQVESIVFAFQLENKQETLESALDFMVDTEDYEAAAKIKSKLQEIGSDKVT